MPLQRLAMIGARGHTRYVFEALAELPQVRIVGVSDGSADDPATPLVKWCEENGHRPQVFSDWRKMLDTARPEAVAIVGPFELHAQMCIEAIERGIHGFIEKPAALTFEDLERVKTAHAAHPQIHIVGMMGIRYEPGFFTAWQLAKQGAIGDVRLINARKSYKLGKRQSFYHDRATYGGTILWVGSHALDWVLWMSGQKVTSVAAMHSAACSNDHGTMERAAVCQLGLDGGRAASVSIDVFRPANATTHGDDWIRLVGTSGIIEARSKSVNLINDTNDGTVPVAVSCDRKLFTDFVDQIDGRRTGLVDAAQTLVLTEVCLLAQKSADEGTLLTIDPGKSLKF